MMLWIILPLILFWIRRCFARDERQPLNPIFALLVLLAVTFVGCAGMAGSSSDQFETSGTPAGTSTVTITAASGSLQKTLPLTVVVN
jgi:flagellin-like protein